ncbi:uncharacterized protein B0H18DRAFT_1118993 [Fomitopsis serialis]|uniref:uncharacterized protein n=1 Tax=Fomitopsis serialis TaxID=139415 RepID=UPI0020089962|nr:uncharacterized protein B0H18DRAFT_1118993 [Neoantrodia serialis]KAH9926511.1 hypothetical protein B0H18DRAFT_1118993 [Neoantrodia serialis]
MLAKVFVYALLSFAVVNAAPIAQRDLVSEASSLFGHATSVVGSVWGQATHGVAAGILNAEASSIYRSATSELGTSTARVHATVTTIHGAPVVEVTSVGGPAITLATTSLPGQSHSRPVATTTFAGHTFLIPSSVSHSHSHTGSASSHRHHISSTASSSSSHSGSSTASSSSSTASSTWTSAFPTSNGALSMQALSMSKPMMMGAVTVLTSLLGGAFIVL